MAHQSLRFSLQDGYLHNWLVAGPQIITIQDGETERARIAARYYQPDPGFMSTPEEGASYQPSWPEKTAAELKWEAAVCMEDHVLDLAGSFPSLTYVRTWAYTTLFIAVDTHISLTIHNYGPAEVWLNGVSVLRQQDFGEQLPHGVTAEVELVNGQNELLVRVEQVSNLLVPYGFAMQVSGVEDVTVDLPVQTDFSDLRQKVEKVIESAYLDRSLLTGKEELTVHWPGDMEIGSWLTLRLQTPEGHIYAEKDHFNAKASAAHTLANPIVVPDGPYQVRVMADLQEFYDMGIRAQRDLDVNLLRTIHASFPYGTINERASEVLEYAARKTVGIYSEIAKMAANWWGWLDKKMIWKAIETVTRRQPGCYENLLGLLAIVQRYTKNEAFPSELINPIEQCLLEFDYESNFLSTGQIGGKSGDNGILRYTCRILAGQLYYKKAFQHAGQPGRWHREEGERQAFNWLAQRATGGFERWISDNSFEQYLLALIPLVDFARSPDLREMALVIQDKLLFTLALHTYQGTLASSQGTASTVGILDGQMQATSTVSRLLFGMGCFNPRVAAAISLVISEQYELPTLFATIAAHQPEELLSKESHVTAWTGTGEEATPAEWANLVSYQTPEYVLSSVQDYRPGLPGAEEHIWQAVLGPNAQVFVNHPACASQSEAYRPNFWRGNRINPRVAQWRDMLAAIYQLPDDDWMGYTHAHFPTTGFEEYEVLGNWAFARQGNGYIALMAQNGLSLITRGKSAFRELRSPGIHNIWLCFMGRSALDESFSDFKNKVKALKIDVEDQTVRCQSLRDDLFEFSWKDTLKVNGQEQSLTDSLHYESPYCTAAFGASPMEIQHDDWMLRLNIMPILPDQE